MMANFLDMSVLNEAAVKAPTLENITQSDTYLEHISYFSQTVDFLIEYNHEFTEATKTLYKGISESEGDQELIHESFTDFTTAVKKIIDKFLAFLKSLFQRFITNLNSMFKAEGYLKKHEADFKRFKEEHNFDFSGYTFTIFNSDIPHAQTESEWLTNYDVDLASFAGEFTNNSPAEDTIATRKRIEDEMKKKYKALTDYLSGDYYDRLRATIIGKDGEKISESEFAKECFAIFRNDDSDKEEFEVNSQYVLECYSRFKNYEKTKRSIEKTRNAIETLYKNMKKELESMVKGEGSGDKMTITIGPSTTNYLDITNGNYGSAVYTGADGDTVIGQASGTLYNEFEKYKKAKVTQVEQMSNIHALAFAAKLDAAKDMFAQDKTILYKALYRIQGMPKKDK